MANTHAGNFTRFILRYNPFILRACAGGVNWLEKIHGRLIFAALIMYHLSVCKLSTRL
nr:MAG TPA: hypothetical protein [Caudoviricetes sp.]